jgi:GDP-mannose pyrophosphatase NudK
MAPSLVGDRVLWNGHLSLHEVSLAQQAEEKDHTLRREVVAPPDSVAVLLQRQNTGTLILTRQLRVPALWRGEPPMLIEVCAGNIDADTAAMTPEARTAEAEQTARREAEEETGWRIDTLQRLSTLYPSPGISSEMIHLFLATCSERITAGGGRADEGEQVETIEVTPDEAWAMTVDGRILDMKTVLLIRMLEPGR